MKDTDEEAIHCGIKRSRGPNATIKPTISAHLQPAHHSSVFGTICCFFGQLEKLSGG